MNNNKTMLRFRIWNHQKKEFIRGYKKAEKFFHSFCNDNKDERDLGLSFWDIPDDYFIILKSTGLKDKNGIEIYEGDIIRDNIGIREVKIGNFQFQDPDSQYHNFIGVFGVWILDKSESAFYSTDKDLEVIGNIYENPELLNGDYNGK